MGAARMVMDFPRASPTWPGGGQVAVDARFGVAEAAAYFFKAHTDPGAASVIGLPGVTVFGR